MGMNGRSWTAALAIFLVTLAVFGGTAGNGFLILDDDAYITDNPMVRKGLTPEGVAWAFGDCGSMGNWHPLTWLAHMLNVDLFGLDPRGHHLVSVLLHAVNAVMVFMVFRAMTGDLWAPALTAALFALHPLRVESVAWAAELKDILAAGFSLAALLAWIGHLRRPGWGRYALALGLFGAALMSKAMPVSLPFVLLILDWWPLGGMKDTGWAGSARRLVLPKVPFFLMSAAAGVTAYVAQGRGGGLSYLPPLAPGARLANALASCAAYLGKMVWPAGLAVLYPYPVSGPGWAAASLAGALLAVISLAVVVSAGRLPFLAAGWFWYLMTLAPVSGIVQVGAQAMADRYTYFPFIGLFAAVAWASSSAAGRFASRRSWAVPAALAALAACAAVTVIQIGYWRDDETLYRRALSVTGDNWIMQYNLGFLKGSRGKHREAIPYLAEAVRINPRDMDARNNLGYAFLMTGRYAEAEEQFRLVVAASPGYARGFNNLGAAIGNQGRLEEAVASFREAVRLDPLAGDARRNMGRALEASGDPAGAAAQYLAALRLDPGDSEARISLMRLTGRSPRPSTATPAPAE